MRRFRVFVGSAAVGGCLFSCGLLAGGAAAQSAEPVGAPLQLLKLMQPGKSQPSAHLKHAKPATAQSAAKPAATSSTKSSTTSSTKSATKSSTKTRLASRKKPRSYFAVAERKRHQVESALQAAAAAAPAADNSWPAAPTAMTADAATLAPVQPMPAAPQIVAPTAGTPSELVVDGQTVQVASADEVNEIDLAAGDASAANAASRGPKLAINMPPSAVADSAAKSEPTSVALVEAQTPEMSTTSWILQILAALGGAVAAGTVAWFLMRSAPLQVEVSE
jgi:hypothetical protein